MEGRWSKASTELKERFVTFINNQRGALGYPIKINVYDTDGEYMDYDLELKVFESLYESVDDMEDMEVLLVYRGEEIEPDNYPMNFTLIMGQVFDWFAEHVEDGELDPEMETVSDMVAMVEAELDDYED